MNYGNVLPHLKNDNDLLFVALVNDNDLLFRLQTMQIITLAESVIIVRGRIIFRKKKVDSLKCHRLMFPLFNRIEIQLGFYTKFKPYFFYCHWCRPVPYSPS
jgi:hypothetical protein